MKASEKLRLNIAINKTDNRVYDKAAIHARLNYGGSWTLSDSKSYLKDTLIYYKQIRAERYPKN